MKYVLCAMFLYTGTISGCTQHHQRKVLATSENGEKKEACKYPAGYHCNSEEYWADSNGERKHSPDGGYERCSMPPGHRCSCGGYLLDNKGNIVFKNGYLIRCSP